MANAILNNINAITRVPDNLDYASRLMMGMEILTTVANETIFDRWIRTIPVTKNKGYEFTALGKAKARYHTRGTPILGQGTLNRNLMAILVDNLVISDTAIYDLDQLKDTWDMRADNINELGIALAQTWDEKVANAIIQAARSAGFVADQPGGSVIKAATMATDAAVLTASIFSATTLFAEKNVKVKEAVCVLRPAQHTMLIEAKIASLDRDYSGEKSGNYAGGTLYMINGLTIEQSNNIPSTVIAADPADKNNYAGDFTDTVAMVFTGNAARAVTLGGITLDFSGQDTKTMYQMHLIVAKMAMGAGVYDPKSSIELSSATA